MTLYCICDDFGDFDEHEYTLSDDPDSCWLKHLNMTYMDDQWAWRKQQEKERGFKCVPVKLEHILKTSRDYPKDYNE